MDRRYCLRPVTKGRRQNTMRCHCSVCYHIENQTWLHESWAPTINHINNPICGYAIKIKSGYKVQTGQAHASCRCSDWHGWLTGCCCSPPEVLIAKFMVLQIKQGPDIQRYFEMEHRNTRLEMEIWTATVGIVIRNSHSLTPLVYGWMLAMQRIRVVVRHSWLGRERRTVQEHCVGENILHVFQLDYHAFFSLERNDRGEIYRIIQDA